MPPPGAAALLSTAALGLIVGAVAVEMAWLAVRQGAGRLRHLPAALGLGVWSLLVAPVFLAGYRVLWPLLGSFAPGPVDGAVARHPVIAVVVAFVAWDAAGFAYHWLGHRTALGWASHRAHHSGPDYDLSVALRQSWFPLPALVTFPTVALTGIPLELALAVAAVSNLWQALLHTSAPIGFPGWLTSTVMTPATHRMHHEGHGAAVNLGPVLTVWDRLAGTWRAPGQPRSAPSRDTMRPASSACQSVKSG